MLEWVFDLGWSVAHEPDLSPPDVKKIAVELTHEPAKVGHGGLGQARDRAGEAAGRVKALLKRHRYPPDCQEEASGTVPRQAETLSAA